MKTLLSSLALALALGFTMPAFAGDVTAAKNAADCEKAGGTWDAAKSVCSEKKMQGPSLSIMKGRRLRSAPFGSLEQPLTFDFGGATRSVGNSRLPSRVFTAEFG